MLGYLDMYPCLYTGIVCVYSVCSQLEMSVHPLNITITLEAMNTAMVLTNMDTPMNLCPILVYGQRETN